MDASMLRQERHLLGSLPPRGKQLSIPHSHNNQQPAISSTSNKALTVLNSVASQSPRPQSPQPPEPFKTSFQSKIKSFHNWEQHLVNEFQTSFHPHIARLVPPPTTTKNLKCEFNINHCRKCTPWIIQSEIDGFTSKLSTFDHAPSHLLAPQLSRLPMIRSVNNAANSPTNQRHMRSVTSTTASSSSVIKSVSNSSVPDWRLRAHAHRQKSNIINLNSSINSRVLDRIQNRLLQHLQFKSGAAERSNRASLEVRPSFSFDIASVPRSQSNMNAPNCRLNPRIHFPSSLSTASRPLLAPRTTVAHGAGTDSQQSSSQHRQRSDSDYKRPWKQKQFEERTDPPGLSTDVGSVEVPYTPSESLSGWDSEVHLASSPKRSRRGGVPPAPLALGGLGPDKESEAYKARLALRLKQKQYAEVLRQQLPVTTKPPPLKPRPQTPTKRDKMLAYASALPPPNTVASTTPRPRKEKAQKTTEANYVAAETEMRRLIELEHEHELNMQLVESIRRELKL